MTLISNALDLQEKEMVVAVGGGGKTTIINRLAEENLAAGKKVVVSTTTKMFAPVGCTSSTLVLTYGMDDWQDAITEMISFNDFIVVGRELNSEGKITGLFPQEVDKILAINGIDTLLIEGDGAKGKPFKAPRSYEPVIPGLATAVVPVVGVECIGKPLVEKYFHAVEEVIRLTGLNYSDIVNEQAIADILLHEKGYKKNVPSQARWIPFINKVESENDEETALRLVRVLKRAGTERVVIGSARDKVPVKKVY